MRRRSPVRTCSRAIRSVQEIPFPYVLDGGDIAMADVSASEIARWFPTTELAHIGDEVADGLWDPVLEASRPLALFDGLRTDSPWPG